MPGFTIKLDVSELTRGAQKGQQSLSGLEREFKIVAKDADEMARATEKAGKAASSAEKDFSGLAGSLKKLKTAGAAAIAALAVDQLMDIGGALIEASVAVDRLNKAYTSMEGSSLLAAQQLDFVYQTAKDLGLEYISTAESAKTFFAASQGTSLEKDMNRIFTAVSQAGTALSLSSDQMQGVFMALGQMVSKGKVQAEELRGQLGERLPGAFQLAAQAMGMTTAELDKFMADGKLTAEELLPKLADAMTNKYAAAAEQASNGIQQSINRMSTEWLLFKEAITDTGVITAAIDVVAAAFSKLTSAIKAASEVRAFYNKISEFDGNLEELDEFQSYMEDFWDKQEEARQKELAAAEEQKRLAQEKLKAEKEAAEIKKNQGVVSSYLKDSPQGKREKLDAEYKAATAALDALMAKEAVGSAKYLEYVAKRKAVDAQYASEKAALDKKLNAANDKAAKDALKAEKEAQKHLREKADLLKELGELTDDDNLTLQAQTMLIEQQADAFRKALPEMAGFIDQWEQLKKAALDPNLFVKPDQQLKRFEDSMEDFYKSSMDWGSQLANTMQNAFGGMEDALVQFATTGKLSFSDMINSMISDLMRLMIRQSITGPLANAIGQGIGSLFGGGTATASTNASSWSGNFNIGSNLAYTPTGIGHDGWGLVGSSHPSNGYRYVPSSLFADAPRFHGGTGYIKPGEYPAILKKGERVLNPAETRAYQKGREPTVNVNIVNSTGQQATTRTRSDNHGNKTIDVYVGDMAAKQMATPGTTLNRAVSAQTGTRRPAIKR